jgi:transcriptional regulator with XRE-family HTH domain
MYQRGCLKMQHKKATMQAGGYGPITGSENGPFTYGEMIRYTRRHYKLSPDDVAMLYGKIAGRPVTGRHILRMEQTDSFFPKDPTRRRILAQLLNVPPALMALVRLSEPEAQESASKKVLISTPPKNINVEEYRTTLQSYWFNRYTMQVEEVIEDTQARIDRLHDVVLYSRQKKQIISLLCGYQILLADIAQEQQAWTAAKRYFSHAITLAGEKKLYDMLVIALFRRAAFFNDLENGQAALRDAETAKKIMDGLPPQLRGKILTIRGRAKASLAQDEDDFTKALEDLDTASKLIGNVTSNDDFMFAVAFDKERYLLDRAATFMSPTVKKLRAPQTAQELLDSIAKEHSVTHQRTNVYRQAYGDLIQAKIYYDQKRDLVAIATAENVLNTLRKIGSGVHLNSIEGLLQELKERNPNNIDVLNLELELMKARQPYLFN